MEKTKNNFDECFYHAQDGLRLFYRDYQPQAKNMKPQKEPIICLPGLTRTSRDFHAFASFFSQKIETPFRVISIDYRGRGQSQWDQNWQNYTPFTETQDLINLLNALNIAKAHFIGTSRGGILMHILAAMRPTCIKSTILNDIGPHIHHKGLLRLKNMLLDRKIPKNWKEASYFLNRALGNQFPAFKDDDWDECARLTFADKNGTPIYDYDTALLKTLVTIDSENPPPDFWPQYINLAQNPIAIMRGEHSTLLNRETVKNMKEQAPHLQTITVKGQGHAPHLKGVILEKLLHFVQSAQ